MTTYGSTITLNWEKLSHLGVPKHSHKITHGTCASADVNAIIGRWVIPANPDGSLPPSYPHLTYTITNSTQTASARREL